VLSNRHSLKSVFDVTAKVSVKRTKLPEASDTGLATKLQLASASEVQESDTPTRHPRSKEARKKQARDALFNTFNRLRYNYPRLEDLYLMDMTTAAKKALFAHHTFFLETGKIQTYRRTRWAPDSEKWAPEYKNQVSLDTEHLAHCYCLGVSLKSPSYCNAILRTIIDDLVSTSLFPSDKTVKILYAGTAEGSPARKLMVDLWAYLGWVGWLEGEGVKKAICVEFLEDLVPALFKVREKPSENERPWVKGSAKYMVEENEAQKDQEVMDTQD